VALVVGEAVHGENSVQSVHVSEAVGQKRHPRVLAPIVNGHHGGQSDAENESNQFKIPNREFLLKQNHSGLWILVDQLFLPDLDNHCNYNQEI
jgi:hypothetical protein